MIRQYSWSRINLSAEIKLCKQNKSRIICNRCKSVLIDSVGRVHTKKEIWEYKKTNQTIGYSHSTCAYTLENKHATNTDVNFEKSPDDWI